MLYMQENFGLQLSAMVFNLEQSLSKRRHYRPLGMDNSLPVGWMAGGSVGEGGQVPWKKLLSGKGVFTFLEKRAE